MVRLYTEGDALCKSYLQQRMTLISKYKHSGGWVRKIFRVRNYVALPLNSIASLKAAITMA